MMVLLEAQDLDYVIFEDPAKYQVISEPTTEQSTQPESQVTILDKIPAPKTSSTKTNPIPPKARSKYEKDNKNARAAILQRMRNAPFDIFWKHKSAKMIWNLLHKKYRSDDMSRRKYAVSRWLNFRMTDSRSIVEYVHEYENLIVDMLSKGSEVNDTFLSNSLIEKFLKPWSDFNNKMKHERRNFTLQ